MAIKYIHYWIQMRPLILIILISATLTLKNVPLSSTDKPESHIAQLQDAQFLPDQILLILRDQSKFMYLNKIEGKLDMLVQISDKEKVVQLSYLNLLLLEKDRLKSFSFLNKTLSIERPFKYVQGVQYEEIISYLRGKTDTYILTDRNIIKVPVMASKLKNESIKIDYILNKSSDKPQKYLSLVRAIFAPDESSQTSQPQIFALVSQLSDKESKQICMKLFQGPKQTKTSCFQVSKDSQYEKTQYSLDYFYVVMSDKTYIVDKGLKVRNQVKKRLISVSDQAVVFDDGSSFLGAKNAVVSELTFESQQYKVYKLNNSNDMISLVEPSGLQKKALAEIKKQNDLTPINAFLNEVQDEKQAEPQFELLIQWNDLSLSFFSINKGSEKLIWRVEKPNP